LARAMRENGRQEPKFADRRRSTPATATNHAQTALLPPTRALYVAINASLASRDAA